MSLIGTVSMTPFCALGAELFSQFRHDKHFFELAQFDGWFDLDAQETIAITVRGKARDGAHRQPSGKDAITASRDHLVANLDLLVRHHVLHLGIMPGAALENPVQVQPFQEHASAALRVIDEQYLRCRAIRAAGCS